MDFKGSKLSYDTPFGPGRCCLLLYCPKTVQTAPKQCKTDMYLIQVLSLAEVNRPVSKKHTRRPAGNAMDVNGVWTELPDCCLDNAVIMQDIGTEPPHL